MITVLHWEYETPDEQTETELLKVPTFKVALQDDILQIDYDCPFKDEFRGGSFQIDISQNIGKILDVYLKEADNYSKLDVTTAFEYCGRYGYDNPSKDGKKMFRIVVDTDSNIFVLIHYECNGADGDGVENHAMKKGLPSSYYLKQKSNYFKQVVELSATKYQMLKHMDCYMSLSYLEAQVDLLTKLVIQLTGENSSKYLDLLKIADEYSVVNIKPFADIENEFTQKKSKVRTYQERYYEDLQ